MTGAPEWDEYWRDAAPGKGCLPGAPGEVSRALERCWVQFARSLPRGARVLDIASGDGAVARALLRVRKDLRLEAVDLADIKRHAADIRFHAGVDAAALPFPDASFSAATSQFGIEYAAPEALDEAVRVLQPGGTLRLVIHHRASRAVRHNAGRAAAIRALLDAGLEKAARRAAARLPSDPAIDGATAAIQARHRGQSVVIELPAAFAQALARPDGSARIAELVSRARAEVARLVAMQSAARDAEEMRWMVARMEATASCTFRALLVSEAPIAWRIDAVRRA